MNPISAFFVQNIVAVFFFYGLAFFTMGLALALASRRTSEFRFAQAIRPLAAFGILHGIHEWIEMFQKIATLTSGYTPTVPQEVARLAILVVSFLMLILFGMWLLTSEKTEPRRGYLAVLGIAGLSVLGLLVVTMFLKSPPSEIVALSDTMARYSLGIPGALLGTWALMRQQRTFHEHGMPQFGRDLVWCATALFLYGAIGQLFVRQTLLVPSTIINSTLFLQWFGIPVQLFRGVMAAILAFYMVRALNAFDLESQRRLEEANQAKLRAQEAVIEAERRISREMERLNEELRLTAHELSLLLDLSNLLVASMSLQDRLHSALGKIVHSLSFPDAGMILLVRREARSLHPIRGTSHVRAVTGFSVEEDSDEGRARYISALDLGERCAEERVAMCRHVDGTVIEFTPEEAVEKQECRRYESPVTVISLPLIARQQVIGSVVLAQAKAKGGKHISFDEFKLMVGIAQQLGLSIENAALYEQAQEREEMLAELLHQAVEAQEAERQRIARELHDATGQSLTAIALGLRGVETMLTNDPSSSAIEQIGELKSFSTNALGELRRIIADLRPSQLDDLGLVAALQWYTQDFEKRYAIPADFIVEGDRVRLPAEYETVLFRITQEALTNIARHADASHAAVKLEITPAGVCVIIKDDGRGFDLEEMLQGDGVGGWGLLGIQERALLLGGRCDINSAPGRGTCIQVSVPLPAPACTCRRGTRTCGGAGVPTLPVGTGR
jgi:signal transduction histidine kinase